MRSKTAQYPKFLLSMQTKLPPGDPVIVFYFCKMFFHHFINETTSCKQRLYLFLLNYFQLFGVVLCGHITDTQVYLCVSNTSTG